MMRFTEEGYQAMHGNAVAGFLNACGQIFGYVMELCRHFAIIKYMDGSADVQIAAVLPARWFGTELVITNLNLMNVTFTSFMILQLRTIFLTYSTGGKRFVVINTPINIKPVYSSG
jgi:hypothetical protein